MSKFLKNHRASLQGDVILQINFSRKQEEIPEITEISLEDTQNC